MLFKHSAIVSLLICALMMSTPILAQEAEQAGEAKAELKVSEEDELAPVKEIQERLKERLSQPLEALDLDIIMEGPAFFGYAPRSIRWDGDSSRFWFEWQEWNAEDSAIYEYSIGSDEPVRLETENEEMVPPPSSRWRNDFSEVAWVRDGTLYRRAAGAETEILLKNINGLRFVDYAADGGYLLRLENNVLLFSPGSDTLLAVLSDIRQGARKDDEPKTESQKWLALQQRALFEIIDRRESEREEEESEAEDKQAEPYYLGGKQLVALVPDSKGEYAVLGLRQESRAGRRAEMPSYVTASGYTESRPVRLKAGDAQAENHLGVLHMETGAAAEADFGLKERKPAIMGIDWSPDNSSALVQLRAQDNKDRWFFLITPVIDMEAEEPELTLNIRQLSHDHDEAWINWDVARNNGWLPDGSGYYFISERDGWRNLYVQNVDEEEPVRVFGGARVVHSAELHPELQGFVVTASFEDDLHRVQTFYVSYDGQETRQLTDYLGWADAAVSPDGSRAAVIASHTVNPPELFIRNLDEDDPGLQLTDSPSPAYKSYEWQQPSLVYIPAKDGTMVPAQVYEPEDGAANGAGVVFVHGAGYRQNVHKWWRGSSYGRVYCFNLLLAEAGYTVIDIDFRGSEGYGRDWRTAIYRSMGDKDLQDQVDGAGYLIDNYGVEAGRIGIYGGSYGGFITLMAMFNAADVFAAGAAMRPVTDWAHYNHPYTSNILNTPQDDPDAYLFSSPIYHAEGLKGALLITHGIVDDNVHIQGVFRLVQRLIELRKENWEVAVYPVERHGFREPSSWVDQYRRIMKLFDENLLK